MKNILLINLILVFLICSNIAYNQNSKIVDTGNSESKMTEYDYYENLRLERKENKVKTISSFGTFNDVIEIKDYFDEDGYLRKREFYLSDLMGENSYAWKEISDITYDETGNMSGNEIEYGNIKETLYKILFNKISPSNFYDIGFGETTVNKSEYIFDKESKLIEKRSYGEHLVGTGKEYESQYFYYDNNNRLIESRSTTGESAVSITKYFYNEKGLLEKEAISYDFQNGGRDYGMRYEYEYYE